MVYLDLNENILLWSAEGIEIPYISKEYDRSEQMVKAKKRRYYPDFYYKIKRSDGSIREVIAEVKPMKEVMDVELFNAGSFDIPDKLNAKKLKGLEYRFKSAQMNSSKWESMEEFARLKGMAFIIITEDFINKLDRMKK